MIPLSRDVADLVGEFADSVDNRSLLYEKFAFPKVWGQPDKVDDAGRWNVLRIVSRGSDLLKRDAARLRHQASGRNVRPDKAERLRGNALLAEKLSKIAAPDPALTRVAADNTRRLLAMLEQSHPGHVVTFTATLGGRLLVNMSGGVIENAGISLDRCFGLPYLPGSAVKGITRSQALWEIHDAAPAQKAKLLRIAMLLFGYSSQDIVRGGAMAWAGACDLAKLTASALGAEELKGIASFLPASPTKPPTLVVDIVNAHYPGYYGGRRDRATDDENPVPNYFPAVETGAEFGFAVLLNRSVPNGASIIASELLQQAKQWLEHAVSRKGAGAKTAAGYGWFEIGGKQAAAAARVPAPSASEASGTVAAQAPPADSFIARWRGRLTSTGNFAAALPELNAITDDAELKRAFDAVIPENERRRIRKNQPYWQSFTSGRHGVVGGKILERLGLKFG